LAARLQLVASGTKGLLLPDLESFVVWQRGTSSARLPPWPRRVFQSFYHLQIWRAAGQGGGLNGFLGGVAEAMEVAANMVAAANRIKRFFMFDSCEGLMVGCLMHPQSFGQAATNSRSRGSKISVVIVIYSTRDGGTKARRLA
jgi:hypothetical protein